MLTVYNPHHALHQGQFEMFRGALVPCFEVPARVDFVLDELHRRGFDQFEAPGAVNDEVLARVHSPRYLNFLETAWSSWIAIDPANATHDVLPSYWPAAGARIDVLPASFSARLGFFALDAGSPLMSGTWDAAHAGARCAITAAMHVGAHGGSAFALTRPPGHHAGVESFGGYCFLNNAAIAAQVLRDRGAARVAVIDVDFHHGNGTQSIFYDRDDVLVTSIHGDPKTEYPYYQGHADECGAGSGEGFNRNLPLARGSDFGVWREALQVAMRVTADHHADALVVSLGVDTFHADPVAGFKLDSPDYLWMGEDLARLKLPTVFIFEGGYAVKEIGVNTANVLEGFSQAG